MNHATSNASMSEPHKSDFARMSRKTSSVIFCIRFKNMQIKQYIVLVIQVQKQGDDNTQFIWGGDWR